MPQYQREPTEGELSKINVGNFCGVHCQHNTDSLKANIYHFVLCTCLGLQYDRLSLYWRNVLSFVFKTCLNTIHENVLNQFTVLAVLPNIMVQFEHLTQYAYRKTQFVFCVNRLLRKRQLVLQTYEHIRQPIQMLCAQGVQQNLYKYICGLVNSNPIVNKLDVFQRMTSSQY